MDSEKIIQKFKKSINGNLRGSIVHQALVYNIHKFHSATDELAKARLHDNPPPVFECKKGCNHCCSLRVEVLPPEAFQIARFIQSFGVETRKNLLEQLNTGAQYAEGKTFTEYKRPCSFLSESGACEIYAVRPHKCRKYFSAEVSACKKNNSAKEDAMLVEAENLLAGETISLYKNKKLVMHPAELSKAVLSAFNNPSLEVQWAKGEHVFDLLPEGFKL